MIRDATVFLGAMMILVAVDVGQAKAAPSGNSTTITISYGTFDVSPAPEGEAFEVRFGGELVGGFSIGPQPPSCPSCSRKPENVTAVPDKKFRAGVMADVGRAFIKTQSKLAPPDVAVTMITTSDGKTYRVESRRPYQRLEFYPSDGETGSQVAAIDTDEAGKGKWSGKQGGQTSPDYFLAPWKAAGGLELVNEKRKGYIGSFRPAFEMGPPKTSISSWTLGAGADDLEQGLRRCFDKSLKADPKARGGGTVEMNVSSAGKVTHVGFNKARNFPPDFMECASAAAMGITFKAPGKDASAEVFVNITDKPAR